MSLPDIIVVKKLEVRMIVGVDNWERVQAQPVTIDARVHTDVSMAGKSDHLPHSIHYGILVKQLEATVPPIATAASRRSQRVWPRCASLCSMHPR